MIRKKVLVSLMVVILMMLAEAGSALGADGITLELHRYRPDIRSDAAQPSATNSGETVVQESAQDDESVRECTGQLHAAGRQCRLISWLVKDAGSAAKNLSITIRDIKITTVERDNHVKKGDLEEFLIRKIRPIYRDAATGEKKDDFEVISVSGTALLKYLDIPAGNLGITADVGVGPKASENAEIYAQTRIYLVYKEKKTKKKKKKKNEIEDPSMEDPGSASGGDHENAEEKRKAEERKARAKALREKMKKLTAFIDPKERSNDKDVAVATAEDERPDEGPDTTAILLLMAAAAAAAIFGYLIRSDIKVMRWYRQKKALRRK